MLAALLPGLVLCVRTGVLVGMLGLAALLVPPYGGGSVPLLAAEPDMLPELGRAPEWPPALDDVLGVLGLLPYERVSDMLPDVLPVDDDALPP